MPKTKLTKAQRELLNGAADGVLYASMSNAAVRRLLELGFIKPRGASLRSYWITEAGRAARAALA